MNQNDLDLEISNEASISDHSFILSNLYSVKRGGFGNPEKGIVTYNCSLNISTLKEDIQTFDKLTEQKSWPISDILQREIDQKRVKEISQHYLNSETRNIKYFPPIIIAILPIDQNQRISDSFEYANEITEAERLKIYNKSHFQNNEKAKTLFMEAKNLSTIKGMYVLQISPIFEYNILCWDKTKYYAIIIDGQHRYEALLKSADTNPSALNNIQDVVFLNLSVLLKNLDENNREIKTPVQAVRTVFYDINNTFALVNIVRNILMNDKDVASLFVQSIVNDEDLKGDRAGKYLEPQLIDWRGDNRKHALPHITSILLLYQIMVDGILKQNVSSINDMLKKNKVEKWVKVLIDRFDVDKKIKEYSKYNDYQTLKSSLDEYLTDINDKYNPKDLEADIEQTIPFIYDYRVLKIAQETFQEKLCSSIIKVFHELIPYKEAIQIIKANNGFDKSTNISQALISSFVKLREKPRLNEALEDLKKKMDGIQAKYSLFYMVIGQKALFELYFKRIDKEFNPTFNEELANKITEKFIGEMNLLIEKFAKHPSNIFSDIYKPYIPVQSIKELGLSSYGQIASHFWEGIILQDGKVIFNSRGVSSLRGLFEYIISYDKDSENNKDFNIPYLQYRVEQSLIKNDIALEDNNSLLIEIKDRVVLSKRNFLNSILGQPKI